VSIARTAPTASVKGCSATRHGRPPALTERQADTTEPEQHHTSGDQRQDAPPVDAIVRVRPSTSVSSATTTRPRTSASSTITSSSTSTRSSTPAGNHRRRRGLERTPEQPPGRPVATARGSSLKTPSRSSRSHPSVPWRRTTSASTPVAPTCPSTSSVVGTSPHETAKKRTCFASSARSGLRRLGLSGETELKGDDP
jgi:hypothetical protein